jgi:predicted acetyltransferase
MCDRCGTGLTFFGLAEPQEAMLESYANALRQGWSPDSVTDVSPLQLQKIGTDPLGFLADQADQNSDGLCLRVRWMWDGDFCGSINFRFPESGAELPPKVPGHIGYAVVPWKRNHGYASRALRHVLEEMRDAGQTSATLTMAPDNTASRLVAERNGGILAGDWSHPEFLHGARRDRFLIDLTKPVERI